MESESVNEKRATYNPENGEEMTEFFKDYFDTQVEIYVYEFEKKMNYMYPEIFTVSADVADIQTILKIADFPVESVIEEALSFEGELSEPIYGDKYATEYNNDLGLGVDITIKGSIWNEKNNKPYSLTVFYDKSTYDKYVG